jgi:hypothetical protein
MRILAKIARMLGFLGERWSDLSDTSDGSDLSDGSDTSLWPGGAKKQAGSPFSMTAGTAIFLAPAGAAGCSLLGDLDEFWHQPTSQATGGSGYRNFPTAGNFVAGRDRPPGGPAGDGPCAGKMG